MDTSDFFDPEVSIHLQLYAWRAGDDEPSYSSQIKPKKAFVGKGDDVVEYRYFYCYRHGSPMGSPIQIQANTLVSIEIPGGQRYEVLACMVNDMKTGEIVNFSVGDTKGFDRKYRVAEAEKPSKHNMGIEDISANPIKLNCNRGEKGLFKLTFFVLIDDVIIPCDPEFDDEGELDATLS